MTLLACAYVFGAAVTGSWLVGIGGVGKDWYDRAGIAVVILLWPAAWCLAAGAALADFHEITPERK